MKKYRFICLLLLGFVLCIAPSTIAQGLPATSLQLPGVGMSQILQGLGIRSGDSSPATHPARPTVRLGYLGFRKAIVQSFLHRYNVTFFGDETVDVRENRLDNVWLGLSLPVALTDNVGLEVNAGAVLPNSVGAVGNPAGYNVQSSDAENTSLGYVEGVGRLRVYGSTWAIAGFRWDQTNLRINSERRFGPFTQLGRFDTKVNGLLPFVGLQLLQSWSDTELSLRVIGFPVTWGNYHGTNDLHTTSTVFAPSTWINSYSHTFNNGDFFDAFLEYKSRFPGRGFVGLFLGFTSLRLIDSNWGVLNHYLSSDPTQPPGATQLAFTKKYWTAGASFGIDFTLP